MPLAVSIKDQEGATAVEYAVLLALIATVIIVTVASLGENTSKGFNDINAVFPADKQDKCKDSSDDPDCGLGND